MFEFSPSGTCPSPHVLVVGRIRVRNRMWEQNYLRARGVSEGHPMSLAIGAHIPVESSPSGVESYLRFASTNKVQLGQARVDAAREGVVVFTMPYQTTRRLPGIRALDPVDNSQSAL